MNLFLLFSRSLEVNIQPHHIFRFGGGVPLGRGDRRRCGAGGGAAHDPGDHQLVPRRADQEQPQPHLHAPLQEGPLPALHDQPRIPGPLPKPKHCELTRFHYYS